MRRLIAASAVFAATALFAVAGATPSQARDYPVCSRSPMSDFNPSCSFDTMRQCMATISGVGGDCIQNPGLAYDQVRQPHLRGKAARAAARAAAARDNDWDNGGWDWNRHW